MRSKSRAVIAVLVAAFAFSALTAGAAQAEPTYYHEGAAITKALNVRYSGGRDRYWWVQRLHFTITCENESGTGTITTKGEGTVASGLKYTGCELFETKENPTTKQSEEGAQITSCTVSGGGGPAGEIKMPALKSKLVYKSGSSEKELLVRLEPETGTSFVTMEFSGSECALEGKWEAAGKELAWIPRVNEEVTMGDALFETVNAGGAVSQRFTEYELGGVKTTEVERRLGTNVDADENAMQVELEPIDGKRGLFSAHT